ncbi:hypothetical protein ACJX0J_024461, partial [Zea mays]
GEYNGKRCRSTKCGGMEDNPRMVERSRGRTAQRSPLAAQGLHPCLGKVWRARHGEAMDCHNLVERGSRETEPVGSSGTRAGTTGSAAYMFALLILLLCFGPGNFSCPLISGPIPSEFGSLANLISLDLRLDHNRLKGPIPRELAGLPNLGIVDFSNNDLCGAIPTDGAFQNIPRS